MPVPQHRLPHADTSYYRMYMNPCQTLINTCMGGPEVHELSDRMDKPRRFMDPEGLQQSDGVRGYDWLSAC